VFIDWELNIVPQDVANMTISCHDGNTFQIHKIKKKYFTRSKGERILKVHKVRKIYKVKKCVFLTRPISGVFYEFKNERISQGQELAYFVNPEKLTK